MDHLKIMPMPELIPQDLLSRISRLSPANLCDGMKGLGVVNDGAMRADILPIHPKMTFCGPALTVDTADGNNLPIHLAVYSAKPGYVLVIDGKSCKSLPYLGDLIASTAKAVGLGGIVISGCVRDRLAISEMEYPVFCEGFIQRSPGKVNTGSINCPIICGGIPVNPGDLVVGDCDGVTIVPRALIETVAQKAEEKVAYEERRRAAIAKYEHARIHGLPVEDLTPQWVMDILNSNS